MLVDRIKFDLNTSPEKKIKALNKKFKNLAMISLLISEIVLNMNQKWKLS